MQDRRRDVARSLPGRHGAHVIVVEERDHDLIVESLGAADIEIDDEVHVFLTARNAADLEPAAPDESLQILEHRRTGGGGNRNRGPHRLALDQLLDPAEPGDDREYD